ncbi:hypothetical protein D3C76_317090 [compost metagenome]
MLDDQALGSGTDLAGVLVAADDGGLDGFVQVGVVEHNEGVTAAKFQYALLQRGTGLGADRGAGAHAAGQGHGGDTRVGDGFGHTVGRHVDDFEGTGCKTRTLEGIGQQVSAAHYVRGMLEHIGVAGEQSRNGAAQYLPDREVPRHHGENRAQRTVLDTRLVVWNRSGFRGEHGWAIAGVPFTELRAFFDFPACLGYRLAHFQGDHPCHLFGVVAQRRGQGQQQPGALLDRLAAPRREPGRGPGQRGIQLLVGLVRVMADLFAGGGVDGQGMGMGGEGGHEAILQTLGRQVASVTPYRIARN